MLSDNNWIDISWNGLSKRKRDENLAVSFRNKTEQIRPFYDVCNQVAVDIGAKHKNLYLALSGGCDSENVANALHRNNVPFTPIILIYDNVSHVDQKLESWYAIQWCKNHNIKPLIVHSGDFVGSINDKHGFMNLKPRLYLFAITSLLLAKTIQEQGGKLITGAQLEYYPDNEQMTYLESQLGDYQGFVIEESDQYLEALLPDQHPWAFHYWNADIMAAFVNEWDTNLTMQENKAKIYQVLARPKMGYPLDLVAAVPHRPTTARKFGTRDCALMGTKQLLLDKLVK